MARLLINQPQRIEFGDLHVGDNLVVTTGLDEEAWHYDFGVSKVGHWPTANMVAIRPTGEMTEPVPFELHGCGVWTTPRQNPVQSQPGTAFTPYYEGLIVGSFLWGRLAGETGRIAFTERGQEISAITHAPYRQNTVLDILSDRAEPVSVKDILKEVADFPISLAERDIRATLQDLIASGHISLLQKRVQLFELTAQ